MSGQRMQGGFILIYVVGMLAALTALIIHTKQSRSVIPLQLETQIDQALQTHEIDSLLDFTILLATKTLPEDPRYAKYQDVLRKKSLEELSQNSELALLKSMLSQVGFQINIEDNKLKPGTTGQGSARGATMPAGDALVRFPLGVGSYPIKLGENQYQLKVQPGNDRPNLNAIPYAPLWRYLRHLGMEQPRAQQLAANLIDWRDPDEFSTEGLGKESDYYRGQFPPYATPNTLVTQWQSLAYVAGVGAETVALLRENFTLNPTARYAMHIQSLTPGKLAALLNVTPQRAQEIIKALQQIRQNQDANVDPWDRLQSMLGDEERRFFAESVTRDRDLNVLRLTVSGKTASRSLDYDTRSKRVLSRW